MLPVIFGVVPLNKSPGALSLSQLEFAVHPINVPHGDGLTIGAVVVVLYVTLVVGDIVEVFPFTLHVTVYVTACVTSICALFDVTVVLQLLPVFVITHLYHKSEAAVTGGVKDALVAPATLV